VVEARGPMVAEAMVAVIFRGLQVGSGNDSRQTGPSLL
jgi:hypothetical protein